MGTALTLRVSTKSGSAGYCKITTLGNVVVGEREAVLSAANRAAQSWDFADALHVALSQGCEDFTTLDVDLIKRAAREAPGGKKATLAMVKL